MGMFDSISSAFSAVTDKITPGVGSLLGAGLNFLGQSNTNQQNADRADAANAWSAQQYATRYQTMRKDLEAAGLNPMLAYSQSPGTAPTAQQVTFQNPMSAATQGFQQIGSAQQANAEVEKTQHMNEQIDATVEKIKEETKNLPAQREQIYYTIRTLAEQAEKLIAETKNVQQATLVAKETVRKIKAETQLLNNQAAVEASLDNLGRTSKELAPAASILLDIIRGMKR